MKLRRVLILLAALLPGLAAVPAAAADADTLAALRHQQLALYTTMREFHMVALLSGDPQRMAQLRQQVADLGKSIDSLPAAGGNQALDTAIAAVRKEWPMFRKSALSNRAAEDGEVDQYALMDMRSANSRLQDALAKAIAAIPGGGNRAQSDALFSTALLIQQVTNEYLFIATDPSGGMATSAGEGEGLAIDQATRDIDERLKKLSTAHAKNADVSSALQAVNTKWNFVRKHLLEISKQSVPFVVDRYATSIDGSFRQAIKAVDGR